MLTILLFFSDLQISKYNVINIFQSKGLPRYLSLHQSHKYLVLENISYFLINHNLSFYLDITLVYLLFFTIPSILSRYSYFFTWFKQSKYPFKRVLVTVPILDMSLNFTGLHFLYQVFIHSNIEFSFTQISSFPLLKLQDLSIHIFSFIHSNIMFSFIQISSSILSNIKF